MIVDLIPIFYKGLLNIEALLMTQICLKGRIHFDNRSTNASAESLMQK